MSDYQIASFAGPLYEQIHKMLRSRILAGEWESKQPLPAEAQLSRQFGVSIGTVRKAMDQLIRDNIVIRERGRGTFVRRGAEWRQNSIFRLRDRNSAAVAPEIRVVHCAVATASSAQARALQPRRGAPPRLRILGLRREWMLSGTVVCRETIMVEETRFSGLSEAAELGGETLFELYAERYRAKVDAVRWEFGASPVATPWQHEGACELQAPTLLVRRTALGLKGDPIEVCEQLVSLAGRSIEIVR